MPPPIIPCIRCPLRAHAAFKPVTAPQLGFIQKKKVGQSDFAAGEAVVPEGEVSHRLYTLLAGWAFRFKTLPDGRRQILNILLPGDLVGLQSELLSASPHGVEALTPVTLCAFQRDMMLDVYANHPELGLDITWIAANEERIMDDALLGVGRRTAMERVAAILVHLHKRAANVGQADGEGRIAFPLTQTHLADLLGLSAVHVNRTLQRLRHGGLVRLEGGTLAIGDLRALRRVGQYWEQPAPRRPLI